MKQTQKRTLGRHEANCRVCADPERKEIEDDALERIIEQAYTVTVNAGAVVAAVTAYAKSNSQGAWVDRVERIDLNALFERMTAGELEANAKDGTLPQWFYGTVKEVTAKSEIVALAVIADVSSPIELEIGHDPSVMGVLVTTQVREQLKGHPARAGIQFLHFGSSSTYRAGQEYVLFLAWDENAKHFVGLGGDTYNIKISNSRVANTTALEGVSVGMPVSRVLRELRSFLKVTR